MELEPIEKFNAFLTFYKDTPQAAYAALSGESRKMILNAAEERKKLNDWLYGEPKCNLDGINKKQ